MHDDCITDKNPGHGKRGPQQDTGVETCPIAPRSHWGYTFRKPNVHFSSRESHTESAMDQESSKPNQPTVNTGGGAYIGGGVDTGGGKFVGRDDRSTTGLSGDEVTRLFESIYARIDARPDTGEADKSDLKAEVQEVQAETAKGDQANEDFLTRRLRSIGRMAPDILDVVLATLSNPAAGIAAVVRKVAQKVKESSASSGA